jgi:hypothetical protein
MVSWCSWLSRQSNTLKVSGSNPGDAILLRYSFLGQSANFGRPWPTLFLDQTRKKMQLGQHDLWDFSSRLGYTLGTRKWGWKGGNPNFGLGQVGPKACSEIESEMIGSGQGHIMS